MLCKKSKTLFTIFTNITTATKTISDNCVLRQKYAKIAENLSKVNKKRCKSNGYMDCFCFFMNIKHSSVLVSQTHFLN